MRRVQRLAYRTAQLADHRPGGNPGTHRRHWEEARAFQPLRELVERALIAYDWGEAPVVTNIVIKPHFDRLVDVEFAGALADMNDDPVLRILSSRSTRTPAGTASGPESSSVVDQRFARERRYRPELLPTPLLGHRCERRISAESRRS
jgi:hypothetical protein